MRQSLSRWLTLAAVASSGVLAAVALADQTGARTLAAHAGAVYGPYGVQPDPGLLYGLVHGVAAVDALLWLAVLATLRSRHRRVPAVVAGAVVALTATLAVTLLAATEYGSTVFPLRWGALAALPAVVGAVAVPALLRRPGTVTS